MKIAIIADTHDNVKNTEKVVEILNNKIKPDLVIHLGDFCSPFIIDILGRIKAEVEAVFGNNDGDIENLMTKAGTYKNFYFQPTFGYGEIRVEGRKIFFNHFPDLAKDKAKSGEFDLVLYAHTHKKGVEKVGKTLLVNPGEIGGIFHPPSFAVYSPKENKVKFIDLN